MLGHVGAKLGQVGVKMGQHRSKIGQHGAKMCQHNTKLWRQDGPTWRQGEPKWGQDGPTWRQHGDQKLEHRVRGGELALVFGAPIQVGAKLDPSWNKMKPDASQIKNIKKPMIFIDFSMFFGCPGAKFCPSWSQGGAKLG